jgi:predicted Rossmann fold flavoprotein
MQNINQSAGRHEETIWDVIVIGGGASGMMSAGVAGSLGKKVLILEKNETLGKKLLITGGGRCNVTNAENDLRVLLSKFKDSDKFLFSAFTQFSNKDTLEFFNSRGMETKIEALGRVFPITNKAQTVWDVLLNYLKENKVTISSNSEVSKINTEDGKVVSVTLKNKKEIKAKSFILATGGMSRPETGSTGDGFKWLKDIGHNVVEPIASLVPIKTKTEWVTKLQGISVEDVKITLLQNNEKQSIKRGKILFTHFGLSGPTILNTSSEIAELLKYGEVFLSLDLLPAFDHGQLNQKLQDVIAENSNKKYKNILDNLLPSSIANVVVEISKIDPDKKSNSVTREERLSLIELIKNLKVEVDCLLGEDKAIVTSGGVVLEEVDFKTMASKLFPNLYLIGDILNIDRPSGGYSLQLCWTTGYVAGQTK